MTENISAAILAGGENKRFGGIIKACIVVDGQKIISRIVRTIDDLFSEKFLVTNSPEEFREEVHCTIISDQIDKCGPLGGIHAALKNASGEAVFIFAGDMPYLEKHIIEILLENFRESKFDALLPQMGGLIEPLHAIYRKSILGSLEKYLSENNSRAVHDFLKTIDTGYISIPETKANIKAFTNINSPEDISRIIF